MLLDPKITSLSPDDTGCLPVGRARYRWMSCSGVVI
jgi:hypothetical protein